MGRGKEMWPRIDEIHLTLPSFLLLSSANSPIASTSHIFCPLSTVIYLWCLPNLSWGEGINLLCHVISVVSQDSSFWFIFCIFSASNLEFHSYGNLKNFIDMNEVFTSCPMPLLCKRHQPWQLALLHACPKLLLYMLRRLWQLALLHACPMLPLWCRKLVCFC